MGRKLTFMCFVLAFVMVSTGYGYVIGDWEGTSLDGWTGSSSWSPSGNPSLTPGQTVGVTLNDGSLLVTGPIGPEPLYWQLFVDLSGNAAAKEAFESNTTFEIDVTRLRCHWQEDTDPNTATINAFKVATLGGGASGEFRMESGDGLCPWEGTDDTQTISFNYVDAMGPEDVLDAGWWLQIAIATHVEGYSSGGIWYFDNARIVPEPMTIALMGLGGLGLLRRKR